MACEGLLDNIHHFSLLPYGGDLVSLQRSLQRFCYGDCEKPGNVRKQLWFSQTPKLLINWGLPFFLRFPCSPPLVALAAAFLAFFRQRTALQFEILALCHQLGVLQRSVKRPKLTAADRVLWAWLSAVWADWQPRLARKLDPPNPKFNQGLHLRPKLRDLRVGECPGKLHGSNRRRQNRGHGAYLRRASRSSLIPAWLRS